MLDVLLMYYKQIQICINDHRTIYLKKKLNNVSNSWYITY